MRQRTSLAGGLGGTRGLGDVVLLRSQTQACLPTLCLAVLWGSVLCMGRALQVWLGNGEQNGPACNVCLRLSHYRNHG